mmetsp:Transcript_99163/g.276029  ORF Transcript_99163/g.276029 Transcript_99163/m.276029 type:complete len:261 (+) Transcript_99163:396-1178(+)
MRPQQVHDGDELRGRRQIAGGVVQLLLEYGLQGPPGGGQQILNEIAPLASESGEGADVELPAPPAHMRPHRRQAAEEEQRPCARLRGVVDVELRRLLQRVERGQRALEAVDAEAERVRVHVAGRLAGVGRTRVLHLGLHHRVLHRPVSVGYGIADGPARDVALDLSDIWEEAACDGSADNRPVRRRLLKLPLLLQKIPGQEACLREGVAQMAALEEGRLHALIRQAILPAQYRPGDLLVHPKIHQDRPSTVVASVAQLPQ